ncbi:uncharacterized protein TRIVIDRAFT_42523 [Trichoderma virens Gv29-8]|uniref:Zn(2)-C6 fungal-type domain-containing protein n=1 Tax=Hypocrea virens (strain Gv29-8 / FGSC 10586) TaxID=413071 RepID=G9N7E5_HYPVG|nr:uncharacterized protein TRIVIDRAFT_42523 [Trichoderma virens Gv29-8]EHK16911.1 hypothetical protein TRIVIDRAFT_42523 [Trichoderma virens Gv29-8]UKZ55322.1 hypothetical protein TrVGV298_009142 [Trichoderma virens]UKZ81095.1 hypothetical protein TrVFT333_008863 [Trichoderma virens FT-333]
MGRQPRQRPISCHLCRVRKLRCSRQFPCSNCTSRGVVCQHEGIAVAAAAAAGVQAQVKSPASPALKDASTLELLARLERLENLVASQGGEREDSAKKGVEKPAPQAQAPVMASRPVPPRLQRLTADALELERSCSDQKLMDSLISDPIIFRTCPIRLAPNQPSYAFQNGHPASMTGPVDAVKCIWLPRRDEMRIILQKYIADISLFYHIIHVPTVQSLVEDIYAGLEANVRVDVGGILLLLSICASTTYAWSAPDDIRCLFSDYSEANAQSTFWVKEAMDVVDHAQRTAHASLECIQGLTILFLVFCNYESVSFRARSVFMSAVAMATELSLHRLDDPQGSPMLTFLRMSEARKEIGRRVWWFMVATDWTLAQFNCPQEGFYLIHQNQMAVNKPRNANDEDIMEGAEIVDRPATEATCVSYFVQRIRLAEVCRALVDRTPLGTPTSESEVYKGVLEADAKLNQFIREAPDFLALDCSSLDDLPITDPRRSPFITAQRYMLNLLLHRQLCKIHLPYLAQGTVDPAYAYSRDVCLRSARVVFELDHQLQAQCLPFFNSRLRLAMVLRSLFLASTALVLNACLKGDAEDNGEEEDEVTGAWKILHEAQGQFPPAARLLELSIQILKKYKIKHRALDLLQQQVSGMSPYGETFPMTPDSTNHELRMNPMQQQNIGPEPDSVLMDQHWQMLEGKMDLNTIDWDKLFWGIDAPFI